MITSAYFLVWIRRHKWPVAVNSLIVQMFQNSPVDKILRTLVLRTWRIDWWPPRGHVHDLKTKVGPNTFLKLINKSICLKKSYLEHREWLDEKGACPGRCRQTISCRKGLWFRESKRPRCLQTAPHQPDRPWWIPWCSFLDGVPDRATNGSANETNSTKLPSTLNAFWNHRQAIWPPDCLSHFEVFPTSIRCQRRSDDQSRECLSWRPFVLLHSTLDRNFPGWCRRHDVGDCQSSPGPTFPWSSYRRSTFRKPFLPRPRSEKGPKVPSMWSRWPVHQLGCNSFLEQKKLEKTELFCNQIKFLSCLNRITFDRRKSEMNNSEWTQLIRKASENLMASMCVCVCVWTRRHHKHTDRKTIAQARFYLIRIKKSIQIRERRRKLWNEHFRLHFLHKTELKIRQEINQSIALCTCVRRVRCGRCKQKVTPR